MNITFLIGNGFDLNLGLKTRYQDFYEFYLKSGAKNIISDAISQDFALWADLELGLGEMLAKIDESQIDDFLNSKEDLENKLSEYLIAQESKLVIDESKIGAEFQKTVLNFFNDFTPNENNEYHNLIASTCTDIHYKFITFNYTLALDGFVENASRASNPFSTHVANNTRYNDVLDEPLHIHGNVHESMILGLDNAEQIKNKELQTNANLTNYIIKERVNTELGENRIKSAEEIIKNSKYLCLFGLSIGETDEYWWSFIIKWLKLDIDNRLVIYVFDGAVVSPSGQQKIRFRNKQRNNFCDRCNAEDTESIKDRIIIVENSKIFKFSSVTLEKNDNGKD